MTIQHVGLRSVRDLSDAGMPNRISRARVVCDQAARAITRKDQATCSRQHPASASTTVGVTMSPFRFASLIVDRREVTSSGTDLRLFFAAEPHGAAGVQIGEIEDGVSIFFHHIQEPRGR